MKRIVLLIFILATTACAEKAWEARLDGAGSSSQVLQVRCAKGSSAEVRLYGRGGGGWNLILKGDAFIGKNGLGKTREGDGMSPEGEFGIGTAFGRLPNPGTRLPYLQLRGGIIACDSEGPWYNTIVDTLGTGIRLSGEDMYSLEPEYDYGIEILYNPDRVYPAGSAIFLHCKGAKQWTGGCVAVDKDLMVRILQEAGADMVVSIHRR